MKRSDDLVAGWRCWDCGELVEGGVCYYIHRSGSYKRGVVAGAITIPLSGRVPRMVVAS